MPRTQEYLNLILEPLSECSSYRPAFGRQGDEGVTLDQFRILYQEDPLYRWVGLDSDLMYAAHKAAGGMTSIYRQLGIGCERLLRRIIQNEYNLSNDQVAWSYDYDKGDGKLGRHTLDACIRLDDIDNEEKKERFLNWVQRAATSIGVSLDQSQRLTGAAFEIRQGYKSADSKRQNADLRFGLRAYTDEGLLPVIMIVSTQASDTVCSRYRDARLLVLRGYLNGNSSTFSFFRDVIGYDLAGFFNNNTEYLRSRFQQIIRQLLTP